MVLYQLLCFLTNLKLRVALDIDDCPLDGLVHDPKKYPLYYVIYYSELYRKCFISPTNSAAWLESLLKSCMQCAPHAESLKGELSVERNATLFGFRVIYERMVYIHCHIL